MMTKLILCKDCRHSVPETWTCKVAPKNISPVTGIESPVTCINARGNSGVCGPSAKLFEPHPEIKEA